MESAAEEVLTGGNVAAAVVRVGQTVRKPAGPHTPAVAAFLAHLNAAGFRLRRNQPGVLLTVVDTEAEIYDSTRQWRGRALAGLLHSGSVPADPRSSARTSI